MTIDRRSSKTSNRSASPSNGIPFVMALGMAFWCAYEGMIPEEKVIDVVRRLHEGGITPLLSGGLARHGGSGPRQPAVPRLGEQFPDASFGFHIHNLSGMATANILAALDAGVQWLEGAICGIGGGIAMPASSARSAISRPRTS